jgi:hypothetical protein
MPKLRTLDVSNNFFTGNIPREIFLYPILESFAASSNCFSGKFPDTIRFATELRTLVLDAMGSSEG